MRAKVPYARGWAESAPNGPSGATPPNAAFTATTPAAALRRGWDRVVEGSCGAGVGVLVCRHVEPCGSRRIDAGEDSRHAAPVVLARDLEVRDLGGNVGLPRDPEQLVQRLIDPRA